MPVLYTREYDTSLIDLNEDVLFLYVEAYNESGGGRRVVKLRQHERGLPLFLRENYSESGYLNGVTEYRDIPTIENNLQYVGKQLFDGKIVCVPLYPLTTEITILEKQSPKLAGYLKKRLASYNLRFRMGDEPR